MRASGKLLFPIFRDGSGTVQGILPKAAVTPEVWETTKHLTQESSVIVTGRVRADQRAPGGYELDVENVEVVQRVPEEQPYPITPKEHGVDFLMEHRHLWIRSPRQSAILRIRAEIIKAAARLSRRQRLRPHRSAHPDACCMRRHVHALSRRLLRRRGLPHPERPALHREHRARPGQGLQLRPDISRREIEDPPPSHRVLDGRAGARLCGPRRLDAAGGKLPQLHRPAACSSAALPDLKGDRTRHREAAGDPGALSASAATTKPWPC